MSANDYGMFCFDSYSSEAQFYTDGCAGGSFSPTADTMLPWHTKTAPSYGTLYYPYKQSVATGYRTQDWFRISGGAVAQFGIADSGCNEQIHVSLNPTNNTISLVRGSTILATVIVSTLTYNSLHCVELFATPSLTAGTTQVLLDGNVIGALTLTGINTCNTGQALFSRSFTSYQYVFEVVWQYNATADTPFNKARVYDATFGTLNGNAGTVVGTLDALGVLNTNARGTTNYIEFDAAGAVNATPTALSDFGEIRAVQVSPCLYTTNSGVVAATVALSDGTNTVTSDKIYPAASPTATSPLSLDVAPDGGAWTDAKFSALRAIVSRTA